MKYVSWNVNSVRIRLDPIQIMIAQEDPDIIMLQETKCIDEQFPHYAFPEYDCHIWGQKSYNGVAILTKKHLVVNNIEKVSLGNMHDHARCIKVNLQDMAVICVYVPCGDIIGPKYEHKLEYLYHLDEFVKSLPNERLVIGGDFNVAITDADVEHPKSFRDGPLCLEVFRNRMHQILLNGGLNDAIDPGQYTWWDYRHSNFRRSGVRIDYIFSRGVIGKQFIRPNYRWVNNDISKPSDHVPVVFIV